MSSPGTNTDSACEWDSGTKSVLVSIGTHSLHLYARGPIRKPGEPAVLIITGLAISVTSWEAVQRQLSSFIRVFSYDRSGYGNSDISPSPPTATTIAKELNLLLTTSGIQGPFIIIAHSWAGVLSREFLAIPSRDKDIAGIVFVDANQENTLEVLDWRVLAESPVLKCVDWTGVLELEKLQRLQPSEWKILQDIEASEKHQTRAALEYGYYPKSFPVLKSKSQLQQNPPLLGDSPIFILKGDNGRDFKKLYDAGVKMGNGSETERAEFESIWKDWDVKDRELQMGNAGLSTTCKFVEVPGTGHNVQFRSPEAIVEGVRWVMEQIEKRG